MVTILILTALTVVGILLGQSWNDGVSFTGVVLAVLSILFMIVHLLMYLPKSYTYEKWVTERESFESTLREARQNSSELERAAMTKEVAEWNRKLAGAKYDNNHWFFGQYIDDRVETLEPIK